MGSTECWLNHTNGSQMDSVHLTNTFRLISTVDGKLPHDLKPAVSQPQYMSLALHQLHTPGCCLQVGIIKTVEVELTLKLEDQRGHLAAEGKKVTHWQDKAAQHLKQLGAASPDGKHSCAPGLVAFHQCPHAGFEMQAQVAGKRGHSNSDCQCVVVDVEGVPSTLPVVQCRQMSSVVAI